MVTYNGQLSPGVREVIALLISKESLQDVRVRETLLSKRFTNSYREKSYKQSTLCTGCHDYREGGLQMEA